MRLLRWFFAALQSFLVSRSTPENFPDFPFIFAFYFLSAELQNAELISLCGHSEVEACQSNSKAYRTAVVVSTHPVGFVDRKPQRRQNHK